MQGLLSIPPFRTDEWHLIAQHLGIRDLCNMMRVSRAALALFTSDRAWQAQRARVCAKYPRLVLLFEAHAREGAATEHSVAIGREAKRMRKRRGGALILPEDGTWMVFKTWLALWHKGKDEFLAFRWLLHASDTLVHEACYAMLLAHVPLAEQLDIYEHIPTTHSDCVRFRSSSNPRISVVFRVRNSNNGMGLIVGSGWNDLTHMYVGMEPKVCRYARQREHAFARLVFRAWLAFLFEDATFIPQWTPRFVELMKAVE